MGLSRANLQTIATRTGKRVVAAWSDRDAGAMGTIVGVVMHHTGSVWSAPGDAPTLQIVREGRSDLQNALCTFYIDKAGTIYLITEKVAWHAGQGLYRGITDGNGHFLGIEAESDGVHWTAATIDSFVALVAEICRFLGVDPNVWAIRHAVWATPPGRKTDFSGINEPDFRARVAARLSGTPGGFLMALTDAEQTELLGGVRYLKDAVLNGGPDASPSGRPLKDLIELAVAQTGPVYRPGDPNANKDGLVGLRQELADGKTNTIALLAKFDGITAAISELTKAIQGGQVDVNLQQVLEAAQQGAEKGVADAIKSIDVTVNTA